MRNAALRGYATATDLADYLVRQGIAFRDAHDIVGKLVAQAIAVDKDLSELSLAELRSESPSIEKDVFTILTLEGSVEARNHLGGTAPKQVAKAIKAARKKIR
jgi:argininosuccinate lyase